MRFLICLGAVVVVIAATLCLWRWSDQRATRAEMDRLAQLPSPAERYDPAMVADLPEPVRRYFGFAIAPSTPLYRRVTLQMNGQLGLGTRDAPGYFPFEAKQIIAAPEGFVWALRGQMNGLSVRGSDTGEWTRFWVAGLAPVARAGGTADHRLSAFGRYMAEIALWQPTALVPSDRVRWSSPGADLAQFDVTYDGMTLSVVLHLDTQGRPIATQFQRWSNANPDKTYRFQPFGGSAFEWRNIQGVQIATKVEAGNYFGTDAYFPFFRATITEARFD